MLRGPTVTVLSQKRCQEMRGKRRLKVFVVAGRVVEPPKTSYQCEQLKRTLMSLGRIIGRLPMTVMKSRSTGSDVSGSTGGPSRAGGLVRERVISRLIFYTKVTILTELFSFLCSLSPIGSWWSPVGGVIDDHQAWSERGMWSSWINDRFWIEISASFHSLVVAIY